MAAAESAESELELRGELEAQRGLLRTQHSRIDALEKQLGVRPAEAEDVDLPAAEYARNFYITIAVCVYVCAFQGICAFSLGGREGNASQVMHLVWPICWTMLFALIFGALDSSAAGRRAVQVMRVFASSQVVLAPLLFRDSLWEAALQILYQGTNALFYPWFSRVMADVLRKQGSLGVQAELYTNRALKVLGFQMLLVVSTLALGLDGARSYPRIFAAESFSITRAVRAENRVARDANNGPRAGLSSAGSTSSPSLTWPASMVARPPSYGLHRCKARRLCRPACSSFRVLDAMWSGAKKGPPRRHRTWWSTICRCGGTLAWFSSAASSWSRGAHPSRPQA